MSPPSPKWTDNDERFPRVSGDEPGPDVIGPPRRAFSPRERG